MGGGLLLEPAVEIDGEPAWDWLGGALDGLRRAPNVHVMTRTTAIGYYHQNMVAPCQKLTDHLAAPPKGAPRERMGRVRARQVVLAQGTLERPLVFDGNDRPGVMLASAAQAYLNRYGVKVGNRVVATSHDSAWHAAFDLAEADVGVTAIVDTRPDVAPALLEAAAAKRIEVLSGHTVTGTKGRLRVASVRVNPGPRRGRRPGAPTRLRRALDVRRLDAVSAPLLAHQGHARLGRGGAGVLAGPQGRGLRNRRPRPLGHCRRPERRRRGRGGGLRA